MDQELKQTLDAMRAENAVAFTDFRGEFSDLRGEFTELRGEFTDLRGKVNDLRAELAVMCHDSAAAQDETRRYFDEVAQRVVAETRHQLEMTIDGMRHEIRLVAEAVLHLDEKYDRRFRALEER